MLRIGVLLPRSSLFPAFGLDILNGIKSCLKHKVIYNEVTFLTDNIGFGTDEAEIYSKAEKLLLQDDADVVVIVADLQVKELIEPLFAATNKLLLVVNMGAGIPDHWHPSPTTIVHSLNLSFHARLTGKLAAKENENKKGAFALSYYDAGYRQVYAIMNSFMQNGGEPVYTHITHIKSEELTLEPLNVFLSENQGVTALLCLFTGQMADWFCNEVIALQEKHQTQLYGTTMLLEAYQSRLPAGSISAPPLKGYTGWLVDLDNAANTIYKETFLKTAGKSANLFAVLGWDAGLLLCEIYQQIKSGETSAAAIVPAMAGKIYESPRGWMKLDPSTFHTYASCQLISWSANGTDKKSEAFDRLEEEWIAFTAEKFPPDTSSGWRNTFLCI